MFEKTLLALMMASVSAVGYSRAATLVKDGAPVAVIVLAQDAVEDEQTAAKELQEHLKEMSGAEVEIVQAPVEGRLPLKIGLAQAPDAELAIRAKGDLDHSFRLKVTDGEVSLAGLTPRGTLIAAYELLEQLGCRWFMPGDLGRVVPKLTTITLRNQETVQVPSFFARHLQLKNEDVWKRRARLAGPYFPSSHGLHYRPDFGKNPEQYALIKGERKKRQLCVSNPEVIRGVAEAVKDYFRKNPDATIIGMGPDDGRGFCECDKCRALDADDWDAFGGEISVTDRYMHLFNEVLALVHQEFPGKKIGFYCYSVYFKPPLKTKMDPHIVPAFAPITLCRVHGIGNPVCPDRSYYRTIIEGWGQLLPEIYERGYYFNLACPGFPFSKVHAIRDEVPFAKKAGIKGWRVETMGSWGVLTPTLYVATRLFWNADADVDAILKDFFEKFFGPAAEPMGEYITAMDAAIRDSDGHTGCSFNMPQFYPETLRKKCRRLLVRAEKAAGADEMIRKRVELIKAPFDALEHFVAMLDARNAHDFQTAKQELESTKAVFERGIAMKPSAFYHEPARSYMRRFWSQATEQGYERTTGKNELVAGLPDEWDFFLDSMGIGESIHLYEGNLTGGNWRRMKTSTASWSDQGLHHYKGDAWYRCSVAVPARFAGKKIMIWFGGADEKAKVWVNGQLLGESPGRAFVPFEMDATSAVRPGENNRITVRIVNRTLNEVGTGGITATAMFWTPGEVAAPESRGDAAGGYDM